MSNPILIHINKKYHIPLDNIIKIIQKRWGKVWVYFIDPKTKQTRIAIAKQGMTNLLTVINTNRVMRGEKLILPIIEK